VLRNPGQEEFGIESAKPADQVCLILGASCPVACNETRACEMMRKSQPENGK